jgi:hypothetical protein
MRDGTTSARSMKNFHAIGTRGDRESCCVVSIVARSIRLGAGMSKPVLRVLHRQRHSELEHARARRILAVAFDETQTAGPATAAPRTARTIPS